MAKTGFGGAGAGIQVPLADLTGCGFVGTWTLTRAAAGDYYMALTAAANSPFFVIPIPRGLYLTSFDVIYSIATAGLTTFTAGLYQTQYVNGAVSAVTVKQAPTAIGTVITTNIAVVNVPVTAPYFAGAHETAITGDQDILPDTIDYIELAIVNPGTSVLRIYGVMLYGNPQI